MTGEATTEEATTGEAATDNSEQKDPVLDLRILHLSSQTEIIDLPSIEGQKLYLIPVQEQDGSLRLEHRGKDLLFVDWEIQFL